MNESAAELAPAPPLGAPGEHCAQCAAPLAVDQRYCLNCGHRRAAMRLPFADMAVAGADVSASPAPLAAAPLTPAERSPLVAVGSLLALLLALGIGVLLGRGANDDPAPVAQTPIVTVSAPAAAAAPAGTPATVVGDWPAGTEGYTVSLQTLPATTPAVDVAAAKQAATGKGASGVGVLRSDEYPSLPAGQFVVYAGSYPARAAATKAVGPLRAAFPAAAVIHVASAAKAADAAADEPQAKEPAPDASATGSSSGSGSGYGKATRKPPPKVVTEGPPPPVDDKAPGGGSGDATEIG